MRIAVISDVHANDHALAAVLTSVDDAEPDTIWCLGDLVGLAPAGTEVELAGRWLLNPGSVGQPRDGDPRAAWLLLDTEARTASFHRIAYDVEKTQADMREKGLPEGLAQRLAHGV